MSRFGQFRHAKKLEFERYTHTYIYNEMYLKNNNVLYYNSFAAFEKLNMTIFSVSFIIHTYLNTNSMRRSLKFVYLFMDIKQKPILNK